MSEGPIKSIFEQALGENWRQVSPVVKKHYALRPDSNDEIVLEGTMSVYYPYPALLILAFARLFGGLVLLRENNIPVLVKNVARPGTRAIYWHRSFFVPGKEKPAVFQSRMEYAHGNEIIEYVGKNQFLNLGVQMKIHQNNGAINFESVGYHIKVGSLRIPIPGHLLLGKAYIFEEQINAERIAMGFSIKHPIWGEIYNYSGKFKHRNF